MRLFLGGMVFWMKLFWVCLYVGGGLAHRTDRADLTDPIDFSVVLLAGGEDGFVEGAVGVEAGADGEPDGDEDGGGGAGEDGNHNGDLIFDGGHGAGPAENGASHHAGQGDEADGCHGGNGGDEGRTHGIAPERMESFLQAGTVGKFLVIDLFVITDAFIELHETDDVGA